MRIKDFILSLALFLAAASTGFAKPDDFETRYRKARILTEERSYVAAEKELEELSASIDARTAPYKEDIEVLLLECRIALGRKNIDGLVTRFIKDFPGSASIEEIEHRHANHYFEKEDFEKAASLYSIIDLKHLDHVFLPEYHFRYGFCLLRGGFTKDALEHFGTVIESGNQEYRDASIYYSAYIHYIGQDFDRAIPLLEQVRKSSIYSDIAGYNLLESHFMLKDYDYVVEKGRKLYDRIDKEYKLKVARLLSEAYFEKGMPKEAKLFFEIYSTSGVNLTLKDTYYAGIISYTLGYHLRAIESFKISARENDSIGQSSYYHMASCYIQLKNKVEAMKAYRKAAEMDHDHSLTETSLYNYAKLAFDLNSDISGFNRYLNAFPHSGKADEIYNYIATAYIMDKRYEEAIEALKKVEKREAGAEMNLQKSAFFRGLELMEVGSYKNALNFFSISLDNSYYNPRLADLTRYWKAEAYYRSGDLGHAISMNSRILDSPDFRKTDEYPDAVYNQGYFFLKNGDYAEAEAMFRKYLEFDSGKRPYTTDARLRLADSHFMQKEYGESAELYEKLGRENGTDHEIYAKYQSAVCYGLTGDINRKIDILGDIRDHHREEALYPQSLFELGKTFMQTGDFAGAIGCYEDLLNCEDKTFHPKAALELGMAYFNRSDSENALKYYKKVVSGYPKSDEAQDALKGIENIYRMGNRIDEYFAYLDEMGLSSTKSDEDKELIRFDSAEQLFLNKEYKKAISALKEYLQQYPDGSKVSYANFYIAESLCETAHQEEACSYYRKVILEGEGSFPELAALKFAEISYNMGNYSDAYDAYETLHSIARLDNNIKVARRGMTESAYRKGDYQKTIDLAEDILAIQKISEEERTRMTYLLAKSLNVTGERERSQELFTELAKHPVTEEGAESSYILIQNAYDTGDFSEVERLTFAFSDSETENMYWLARSFIVLGDSYAEREEWQQALATFESILEEYEPQSKNDNIRDQVQMRVEAARKHINNQEN